MRQPGGGNQFRGLKTAGEAVDNLFLQEHEKHKKLEAQKKEYDAWIRDQEQEQCPRCDEPLMVNEGPSWKSFLHHGWNGIVTLHPCQECRQINFPAEREKVLETVPLLFHKATLDDLSYETGKCQKYLSHCKTWAIKPRGFLLLLGAVGNGKTHIGCAILIHHCQGMYITQNDLLNRHRQTYNDHEAPNVLKECIQTEMLVLDEVGVSQKGNDLEVILHDIINVRYVNKLPTVLISNLFGQELEDYLGLRISDRIHQATVAMLKFDEESKRPSCRDDYPKGLEEI